MGYLIGALVCKALMANEELSYAPWSLEFFDIMSKEQ